MTVSTEKSVPTGFKDLAQLQTLITDILRVERNHLIPDSERHENVIEHSFSVTMLCWRIFDMVKPPLDLSKILKYALVHDFPERGQSNDVNTYASPQERVTKKEYEEKELAKIADEMSAFDDLVNTLKAYEEKKDEEALFVWTVDKMQARVLGSIDHWRPYRVYGIKHQTFCAKSKEILEKCPTYLKDFYTEMFKFFEDTYYDQPIK